MIMKNWTKLDKRGMSFRRNYADNNTLHATNKHIETELKDREQGSHTLLKWFTDNLLKANPEKYHHLVSTNKKDI